MLFHSNIGDILKIVPLSIVPTNISLLHLFFRVFFTLMKMMKHSSGLSFIIEKLLHQLNVQVESSALQLDPSSLDWLLLALDHLLDYSDGL